MSDPEARPITEIFAEAGPRDRPEVLYNPVFSPDGDSIAFVAGNVIKKIAATGGWEVTICSIDANPFGLT
jgi:hypothetical protein